MSQWCPRGANGGAPVSYSGGRGSIPREGSMSEAADRYEKLHEVLSDMHRSGECSDDVEDAFHDAMDFLWWRMSEEECADFERRLRNE